MLFDRGALAGECSEASAHQLLASIGSRGRAESYNAVMSELVRARTAPRLASVVVVSIEVRLLYQPGLGLRARGCGDMTVPFRGKLVLVLLCVTSAFAHSQTPRNGVRTSPEAIARARADSARRPYTTADIQFVLGMIHHHEQAILIAGWAPSHDASEDVTVLCARIVNAQRDQIHVMQQWLVDRQQGVSPPAPPRMQMQGMNHTILMPGMLTDEQLGQLDHARAASFDRLFLSGMIQHHHGAVTMVRDLFASPGAGQDDFIFKLASDISVDQTTEISRMQRMLGAKLGWVWP